MNNSVWPQTTTNPTPEAPAGMPEKSVENEPVLSPEAINALEALFSRTQGKPIEPGQILPLLTRMGVINPAVQKEVVDYILPGAKVAPDTNFENPVIKPEPIKPVDYESSIPVPTTPAPGRQTLADLRKAKMNGGAPNVNQTPVPEPAVAPPPIIEPANVGSGNGALQTLSNIQESKTIKPATSPAVTTFQGGEALGTSAGTDTAMTDPNLGKIDIPPINETPEQMAQEDIVTLSTKPVEESAPESVPVTVNKQPEVIKQPAPEIPPINVEPSAQVPNISEEPVTPSPSVANQIPEADAESPQTGSVAETIETAVPPKRTFLQRLLGLKPENPLENASHAAMMTQKAQEGWETNNKQQN